MWDVVKGILESVYNSFDEFLQNTLNIDGTLIDLYEQFITPLPELIKIVGTVFVAIILVLGILSFVKKMLKLFIVLAVILAIVLLVTQLA